METKNSLMSVSKKKKKIFCKFFYSKFIFLREVKKEIYWIYKYSGFIKYSGFKKSGAVLNPKLIIPTLYNPE